jgi:hypothetical protein
MSTDTNANAGLSLGATFVWALGALHNSNHWFCHSWQKSMNLKCSRTLLWNRPSCTLAGQKSAVIKNQCSSWEICQLAHLCTEEWKLTNVFRSLAEPGLHRQESWQRCIFAHSRKVVRSVSSKKG